jgi:hypothetical protein
MQHLQIGGSGPTQVNQLHTVVTAHNQLSSRQKAHVAQRQQSSMLQFDTGHPFNTTIIIAVSPSETCMQKNKVLGEKSFPKVTTH